MTSSTLQEMTRLHLSRPESDAPTVVVAAWYERKAVLLEHLAAEDSHARRLAVEAHQHAARLLATAREVAA